MGDESRKAMRREQIERWLNTDDMTAVEWCRLNHMPTSTFYFWMKRFKEEEPEIFGDGPAKGWIEIAKINKGNSMALAVNRDDGACGSLAEPESGLPVPLSGAKPEPITVTTDVAAISIPAGSNAADIANVIRAVMAR